jgi:hypothetical protein
VSILGGCGPKVTFNTATISSYQPTQTKWKPLTQINNWSWWSDTVGIWNPPSAIRNPTPLEQVKTTHDKTDYFWYRTSLSETSPITRTLKTPANDIAFFYINGNFQAGYRSGSPAQVSLHLPAGPYTLDILTQTVGLQNYGAHYEDVTKGIAGGSVYLDNRDITNAPDGWLHQIGLKGESLKLWNNPSVVSWNTNVQQGIGKG